MKGDKMILLIMAAGMGSRYSTAERKQTAELGPNGEILMEYSISDAIRAGFTKVVFVIKRDMLESFSAMVQQRVGDKIQVEFANSGVCIFTKLL